MVYRFSWIAGISAIALAFWELSSLLRPSDSGTPWQVAILVATLLGAGITWTAIAYRSHVVVVLGANIVAFIITVGLLVAPSTLWFVFPTSSTGTALREAFVRAMDVIRFGVEPVRPVPGLVLLLGTLFWTLGFLLVAGLLNNRPFVAVLTPLIVALQFVIIDRREQNFIHLAVFVGVVALSLLAIRLDERDSGTGRLQRVEALSKPNRRPSPAIAVLLIATVVVAVGSVAIAGDQVPTDGLVTWRSPAGFTDSYSGPTSYNPFTQIQGGLNVRTSNPMFRAEITGADPSTVRFRTVTLDVYRNGRWMTDRILTFPLDEEPWVDEVMAYTGETVEVTAGIEILNLRQPWMPAPSTPRQVEPVNEDDRNAIEVRRIDGALSLEGDTTYANMAYWVRSDMPLYDGRTLAALTLADDGQLSPLFATAVVNGEEVPEPDVTPPVRELPNEDFWLEYPYDEVGGRAFELYAEDAVGNVETNFEKALALESFFRTSQLFTYESAVPSQYTTSDVLEWLTDESNPYVRQGYCEQFATAMALMARAVGVPSRVVLGFTPGDALQPSTVVEGVRQSSVLVTDKNAHAWVELWIPRYGWMAFDPTPRSGFSATTADAVLGDELGFEPTGYLEAIPLPDLGTGSSADIGPGDIFDRTDRGDRIAATGAGGSDGTSGGLSLPSWSPVILIALMLVGVIATAAPVTKWVRRRRLAARLAAGDIGAAWEDIVDRLTDLREPVDPASTPLEAARRIDEAFIPLASTYGSSLYGEHVATTAVIDRASIERLRAEQHLVTHYSRGRRLVATYRPSRLIARGGTLMRRLTPRR